MLAFWCCWRALAEDEGDSVMQFGPGWGEEALESDCLRLEPPRCVVQAVSVAEYWDASCWAFSLLARLLHHSG